MSQNEYCFDSIYLVIVGFEVGGKIGELKYKEVLIVRRKIFF